MKNNMKSCVSPYLFEINDLNLIYVSLTNLKHKNVTNNNFPK